jgi:hypothetical protein
MGLLDDAIREHLELKRLRGADPGEVAREQREALDPVPRDAHAEQDDDGEHNDLSPALGDDGGDVGKIEKSPGAISEGDEHGAHQPVRGAGFSHVGQETAELDMRTVLGGELSAPQNDPVPVRQAGDGGELAGEDSLAGTDEESGNAEESAEDVLEETPDFLRDTPEQERLWFEQRPPRDFDFDK